MYIVSGKNIDDLLSLTASEEVSTFEVINLQDPLITSRWRSTGETPFITGQFASTVTLDTLGLYFTNAESGDQVRLRLADTEGNLTASPTTDTGLISVWPGSPTAAYMTGWGTAHLRHTFTNDTADWFRLDFDYTGTTDGYVELAGVTLGERYQPTNNPRNGFNQAGVVKGYYSLQYADGITGHGGGGVYRNELRSIKYICSDAEYYATLRQLVFDVGERNIAGLVLDETDDTYPMDNIYYGYLSLLSAITNECGREVTLDFTST